MGVIDQGLSFAVYDLSDSNGMVVKRGEMPSLPLVLLHFPREPSAHTAKCTLGGRGEKTNV